VSEHESDAPAPAQPTITKGRRRWIGVLLGFTTLLAVVGMFSIWAHRLLFDPDKFSETSTQLLQNEDIRNATTDYLVDQLYTNANPEEALKEGLPPRLQPLAGPIAGGLRTVATKGINVALSRPRVQDLWAKASKAADQVFIAIVEGGNGAVQHNNGVVTLDLSSILTDVADRLGISADLGSKLPPDAANLTVLKSNQLKLVQDIGHAIKGLAVLFTIIVPLLWALAILLARGYRRRTLRNVGISIVLAGVAGLAVRSLLVSGVSKSLVKDASMKPAVHATMNILTDIFKDISWAFVLVGLVTVGCAWLAGPSRLAVELRRGMAPTMREEPGRAFAIVAAIMLVIFIWQPIHATGTLGGIIVFSVLSMYGTEVLRRQTVAEFPEAEAGAFVAGLRTRLSDARAQRHAPAGATVSLADELERLDALRGKGTLTDAEYETAKASLLHA